MSHPSIPKLPLWATVRESLAQTAANSGVFLGYAWPWLMLLQWLKRRHSAE